MNLFNIGYISVYPILNTKVIFKGKERVLYYSNKL